MIDIESILKAIDNLPPFPAVAAQSLAILDDPESSAIDVVKVVQYDQAITANVLKVCNSAYFGLSSKVGSLHEAVVLLGNQQLKEVILTGTVVRYYKPVMGGYDLSGRELWKHAISTAIMSRIISKEVAEAEKAFVFTAGLLHDVGKTILNSLVEKYFEQMFVLVEENSLSFIEAENEILGIDHAEVGARMGELWGFPRQIVQAIRFHHDPQKADEQDTTTPTVYLANLICLIMGIGVGRQGLYFRGREEVLKRYGLDTDDLQRIMAAFYHEYRTVQDIVDLG